MRVLAKIGGPLIGVAVISFAAWRLLLTDWFSLNDINLVSEAPATHFEAAVVLPFEDTKKKALDQLMAYYGKPLVQLRLQEMAHEILQDRRIREVGIERRWPSELRVRLVMHEPKLIWLKGRSEFFPVARDGSLLPGVLPSALPDLPLLRGAAFGEDQELRQQALDLVESLPSSGLLAADQISEITYDRTEGFVLRHIASQSRIRVGTDHFLYRVRWVDRVLQYLENEGLHARVIDARLNKKVVVSLRNGP